MATMCGRFSQAESSRRLAELFGAEPDEDLPGGAYNVAPTDSIRIVLTDDGQRRMRAARWGFLPFWAASEAKRPPTWINARAETAWESPAFGPALRARRCLIPADAFYEWDRSVRPPQPYAIGPAAGGALLALAGIWSPPQRHGIAPSAAILTTAPNRLLEPLHDRMPVILDPRQGDRWLTADAEMTDLAPLLAPAPDDSLRLWPVSTAVNRVGTDGRELLQPVEVARTLGLA